jgi:hypothetical protein
MDHSKRLFVFWTGSNKLSSNRLRCLGSIVSCSGVNVEYVNDANLSRWLVAPLHPAYKFLSLTHRSDYLRAYFMHYHGGGYSDIKQCHFDWSTYFDRLESSDKAMMIGYRERRREDIASLDEKTKDLYHFLPGMGLFIFKPASSLTSAWLGGVNDILDKALPSLQQFPGTYHPRAITGGVHSPALADCIRFQGSRYPFSWNALLGGVLHPILASPTFINALLLEMPYVNLLPYR